MTIRIAWVSPLNDESGVGTFSHYVTEAFPKQYLGEEVQLTILYSYELTYASRHNVMPIISDNRFYNILSFFDFIVYNIGNNELHHGEIFRLLRQVPGVVIMHDYTYQHYIAGECITKYHSPALYGAVVTHETGADSLAVLTGSRITSRLSHTIYTPWETEFAVGESLSQLYAKLGSALVVHSEYAKKDVMTFFNGPVLRLGMPFDQKNKSHDISKIAAAPGRTATDFDLLNFTLFGHINETKSIELLFEALSSSPKLKARIRLNIVGIPGSSFYVSKLKELTRELDIEDSVNFEFSVPEKRLVHIKEETSVFVNLRFPNTEGASVSLIEQLLTSRPVMVYNTGCFAEIPDDGAVKVGSVGDLNSIIEKMEWCLENSSSLDTIGNKGFLHAKTESCLSYATSILSFLMENNALLKARGSHKSSLKYPFNNTILEEDADWLNDLSDARINLQLLDNRSLIADARLVTSLNTHELSEYIATVVLGAPELSGLDFIIENELNKLNDSQKIFVISTLSLLTLAVFDADQNALHRLKQLGPVNLPQIWNIVLNLRPLVAFKMGAILLLGEIKEMGNEGELLIEAQSRYRVADELLRILKLRDKTISASATDVEGLSFVIERLKYASLELAISEPGILDLADNSLVYRSGFHAPEVYSIWTSRTDADLIFRLNHSTLSIRLELGIIGAATDKPRVVTVCIKETEKTVTLRFDENAAQIVDLDVSALGNTGPFNLTLSIQCDRMQNASPFTGGSDNRDLGVYVVKIELLGNIRNTGLGNVSDA